MRSPILSVVIPTFNRSRILAKCLQALRHQRLARDRYEVIVVDDGSSDSTPDVVRESGGSAAGIRYVKQPHRGPAAARNSGIDRSRGEILLFLGDDVIGCPDLLGEHLSWHTQRYPGDHIAVLGRVTWSPEIRVTPFMRWLEHGGPQFGFDRFTHDREVPPGDLYTANVSYKKSFLLAHGVFDEDFPYAAFEDSELGRRLALKGLVGLFDHAALGYHHHPTGIASYCRRMELVGAASLLAYAKLDLEQCEFGHASGFRRRAKALLYPLYRAGLHAADACGVACGAGHYRRVLDYHRIKGAEAARTYPGGAA